MKQVLTDLHHKRYEWAFQAQKEFLNHFIRLDVQKVNEMLESDKNSQEISISSESNLLPFQFLTRCSKQVETERKLEFEKNKKELEILEKYILEKKTQYDKELNFFHMKNYEFSSKIEKYKEFTNDIDKVIQELKRTDIEAFVHGFVKYNLNEKKASILNRYATQLQIGVEKRMEKQLRDIKAKAININFTGDILTSLPEREPIPKIKQKIDVYWLKSSYDKAFNRLYSSAIEWVEQMFAAYQEVLLPILIEAKEHYEQLISEATGWKVTNEETINELHNEITKAEANRGLLYAEHMKKEEMWKQDGEHAQRLQGYFIKHWLQYKDVLQQQFLLGNPEERWVVSQYLRLLQQDGENIIESMNI